MNIRGFIAGRSKDIQMMLARRRVLREVATVGEISRSHWQQSLADPLTFYLDCFRYFHLRLPNDLQRHRRYFQRRKRGFGEDAFHTMWYFIFREFHPRNFLEIGVYRGQTISLMTLLARRDNVPCDVHGISPFSSAGDSVSRYKRSIDYYSDTLRNFDAFGLPHPKLLKAYSTDKEAKDLISSRSWDLIYIDGNHDYEVAKADWQICASQLAPRGLIVLDDSGLSSSYRPPIFATGGHPGPSKVAEEIRREEFQEILQVGHNRVFQKIGGA